jgi:hypothetical protein
MLHKLLLTVLMACGISNAEEPARLSKADKNYLGDMFKGVERSLHELQNIVANIQNSLVTINVDHNENGKCCKEILEKLHGIHEQLNLVLQIMVAEAQIIGSPSDPSVDPSEILSVSDLDDMQVSIESLLKTILRKILEDDMQIS